MSFLDRLRRNAGAFQQGLATPPAPAHVAPTSSRVARDHETARIYLPSNTQVQQVGDQTYWTYAIRCQLGRVYQMALYFDGMEYQVKVLEPVVVKKYTVHNAHVFDTGRICLNPPANGAVSMQDAFAKATIWATGFSVLLETGKFPFSLNNES